jgi:hypothetical protein
MFAMALTTTVMVLLMRMVPLAATMAFSATEVKPAVGGHARREHRLSVLLPEISVRWPNVMRVRKPVAMLQPLTACPVMMAIFVH